MTRLNPIGLLISIVFFACQFAYGADKPNIIVIVADDLGWNDVGFHGGEIDTPSLDRLAREGVELSRFYTTPICSPTRAALMTGRDPMRLGVAYGVIMPWSTNGVHPDETFLPEVLRDQAGYQTAMTGKWHLGHAQMTYHPNNRGFDHFYGHLHTEVGYFPPFSNQGGIDFQQNGQTINDKGWEPYLLADEASRWIKARDKTKPFFVYIPFVAPHTPLAAPDDLLEKYEDLKDTRKATRSPDSDNSRRMAKWMFHKSARPVYAAVVDGMDQAIGRVLETLDSEGIADNTIVLFFSDNGGAAYATGGADNEPLRGGKGDVYEGGIRVVSVMRWPQKLKARGDISSIISAMDVLPTLAAAAGVKPKTTYALDGRNMLPAIAEGKPISRDEPLFFASEVPITGNLHFTAFDDEWKLVQNVTQGLVSTSVENQLFNINNDPHEYTDLAQKYPKRTAQMAKKIFAWRTMHPISGVKQTLLPPPGWRAPKDWSSFPTPLEDLQDSPATGMPHPSLHRALDYMHGEVGRLLYDCEPYQFIGGGVCK